MPWYEFVDEEDNALTLFYPASEVPSIGDTVEVGGQSLTRVVCAAATAWPPGQKPADDKERALARHMFETPQFPGQVTGKDLVKQGLPTLGSPRWV